MADVPAQHHQVIDDLNTDHLRKLPPFKKDEFEAQVSSTKRSALLVTGMELVSRFLGFCALTWATVVLLGGFASALRPLDFYLISILLLLEGARLFILQTFSKLLSRALFHELSLPGDFRFVDRQPSKALQLDLMGQALSFSLACASCISTIVRLVLSAHGHALSDEIPTGDSNLPTSLRIFYILVLCNSAFAIAPRLLRPLLRQRCHGHSIDCLVAPCSCNFSRQGSSHVQKPLKQDSLVCFHDEVYKMAMEAGLPEADQLSILDFAFTKLARDHQRNIRPPLVKELNMDMIRYLYHGQHGIAMACEYLEGGDVWKQIVAANLPGFWVGEERLESQVALFWALRGRMCGAGKDAESALNSIECLGQAWARRLSPTKPYPFLINEDPAAPATNVVDTLVRLLLEPIRPTLLFQLRAFEACCRHCQVLRHLYKQMEEDDKIEGGAGADPEAACAALQALIVRQQRGQTVVRPEERPSRLRELCRKLHNIVAAAAGGITRTATKIYAGNALLTLLCHGRDELLGQEIRDCFKDTVDTRINPAEATHGNAGRDGKLPYFWVNDLQVLEKLRFLVGLDPYSRWHEVRLIQADGKVLSDPRSNFLNETAIVQLVAQARQPSYTRHMTNSSCAW